MSTPVGIIKRFVEVLTTTSNTGETAVDDALKQFGINSYSAFKQTFSDAYNNSGLSDQDFLEQVCGVRLNNEDTGAITGYDAGGSTTKTSESIIPESTIAQSLTDDEYESFTKGGLTFNVTYRSFGMLGFGSEVERLIVRGLYNWWVPEALDLIQESLGLNFTDGRASVNTINISFTYQDEAHNSLSEFYPVGLTISNDLGRPATVDMTINIYLLRNLTSDNLSGTFSQSYSEDQKALDYFEDKYFDRYVLNALTELALRANIDYFYDLPTDVQSGLKFIVGGYDDTAMANYYSNAYYYLNGNHDTAKAYTFMRWFAKNYSDGYPGDIIYVNSRDDANGNTGNDEFIITANAEQNITVSTNGGADIINGRSTADNLTVVQPSDSTDKVTIVAGRGNDTITVGDGTDVISYSVGDGNDTIFGFNASVDELNLGSDSYSTQRVGTDLVVNVGSGSLTLENVTTNDVSISTMPTGMSKSGTTINVSSTYNGGVWLTGFDIINWTECYADSTAIEVNASSDTQSDRVIVGNTQGNVLRAGYNGAWMWGWAGNDTLYGGGGSDMYWFGKGEGSDVIENCDASDIVNLWSINLSDITSIETDSDNNFSIGISDGNTLKVNTSGTSTTFQLADAGRWRYDHNGRQFSYVQS